MRVAFQKSLITPIPGFLIPLLGIGTGVGAATGIAGVAIQEVQQAQLNAQLPEQEELLKLQKKVTQH